MEGFAFFRCFPKVFIAPGVCQPQPPGLSRGVLDMNFLSQWKRMLQDYSLKKTHTLFFLFHFPFFSPSTPSPDLHFCIRDETLGTGNVQLKCEYLARQNLQPCPDRVRLKTYSSTKLKNTYGSLLFVLRASHLKHMRTSPCLWN